MRPMLAVPAPDVLEFPFYVSTKIDGVRCCVNGARALSKTLEAIPNQYVQRMLGHPLLEGLDGELCVGNPYDEHLLSQTTSGVMRFQGEPDFRFYVFDYWNGDAENTPYEVRLQRLRDAFAQVPYCTHPHLVLLEQVLVYNYDELLYAQQDATELGYEGLMLRRPAAGYKFGRSTGNLTTDRHAKSGQPLQPWTMLKLKTFTTAEAKVTGTVEMMHNQNDAEENMVGLAKRSTSQEGLVPAGVLGALVCQTPDGIEFRIGSGFTAKQRAELWAIRDQLPGRIARYKHFEHGAVNAPRHGVFQAFLDPRDCGEAP